jgi:mono/diheme cytochrome c family protein
VLRILLRALWKPVLAVALVVAVAGPPAFIYFGVYDVAATRQHTPPVYYVLIASLHRSIKAHAAREVPPPPADLAAPERVDRGLVLYDANCTVCHGAPGVAPHQLGLGMTPPPANLVIQGREWKPEELYWVIAKGLKMTGMPAWEFRMSDDELWSVVAFVQAMGHMAPADYAASHVRLIPSGTARVPVADEEEIR